MDMRATLHQAMTFHQQRKLAEAEQLYRVVLQREPLNAAALHHLGLIAGDTGHFGPAMELVAQSIKLDPGNLTYRTNQVGLLDAAGQHAAAEEAARKLVAERPTDLRLRSEYARLLEKYDKIDLAVAEWEQIAAGAPDDFSVQFHFAFALENAGKLDQSEQHYREALRIRPDFGEALVNLAGLHLRTNRTDEGVLLLERANAVMPNHPSVLATLGSVRNNQGRLAEGMAHLAAARKVAPRDRNVLRNLAHAHLIRGQVTEAIKLYEEILQIDPKLLEVNSDLLMARLYLEADGSEELANHRQYQQRIAGQIRCRPEPPRARSAGERIRIGYVSPDFREHPVGHFVEPLLAHRDRTRFEVHCFSSTSTCDALTKRIMASVDGFHVIESMTLYPLDALIRQKQIDILIDLAGHTGNNRLMAFQCKPAPVQMTYLGYPNTTGMDAIDFRITDAIADPPGYSDTIHSEKLIRLPQSFGLFSPPQEAPEVAPSPVRANGFVTFSTVGRVEKWTDAMLASWGKILGAVPGSKFRIIGVGYDDPAFASDMFVRLARAGIERSRVELVGRKPFVEYLGEVSRADLLLDTFPFNGHTTTLQALFMGVPTVTLSGRVHRSRMGASVMHAIGLDDLVASTPADFESIAIGLAKNQTRLADLRRTLRDRLLHSSLCDAAAFARAFEGLLLDAWQGKVHAATEWTTA